MQARWQRAPTYRTVHEEGPEHRKVFTVEVHAQGEVLGSGTGHSKQEAEREAAKAALASYPFETDPAEPGVAAESGEGTG